MVMVTQLEPQISVEDSPHVDVGCCYTVIEENGETFLQIDTYGPDDRRRNRGGNRQSIRFSPEALMQLKTILEVL